MPDNARETLAYESLDQPLSPLVPRLPGGPRAVFAFLGPDGFEPRRRRAGGATRPVGLDRPRAQSRSASRGSSRRARRRARPRGPRALAEPDAVAIVTGPAGGALRRAALRPAEGGGDARGGAAARAAARQARRPRVLGGLRRPRLRRGPLDQRHRRERRDSHAALRPAARARRRARRGRSRSTTRSPALVEELGRALPAGAGPRRAARGRRRACYVPGRDVSGRVRAPRSRGCCPSSWSSTPADPELKALSAARARARAARGLPRLAARPRRPGSSCCAAGYHQQVPVRPGFLQPVRSSSTASAARSRFANGTWRCAARASG